MSRMFATILNQTPTNCRCWTRSCRALYEVERKAREGQLDAAARLALRQERSMPLLDDLKAYLDGQAASHRPVRLPP